MKLLNTLTFILIIISSCNDDNQDCAENCINGEWVWEYSTGGFQGHTITPETEDMTWKLVINDFNYKSYINDSLVIETGYEFGIDSTIQMDTDYYRFIQLQNGTRYGITIKAEALELYEECSDCYNHLLNRQ